MKYTMFSEKHNTLYINSNQLLPNTSGMNFRDGREAYKKAFSMSYNERIERYACPQAKEEIASQMKEHTGCKISEYCNA